MHLREATWLALGCATLAGCGPRCPDDAPCLLGDELAAGLLSVRAPAADDVWVVGASPDPALDPAADPGPVILHWDGDAWARIDAGGWSGVELWWSHPEADLVTFVGSRGTILELDRTTGGLTQVGDAGVATTFFGVWGADDSLWAVGQGDGPPALWRRLGGVWAPWTDPVFGPGDDGRSWFKVHGRAADDLWIVGDRRQTLRWDGDALTDVDNGAGAGESGPLLTVDAGADRTVAVGGFGNGLILEWDGATWSDESPAFQPGWNGVCLDAAGGGWVVGQSGARAARIDGAWQSDTDRGISPVTPRDWHACAVDPDGGLWMAGGRIASRPINAGVLGYTGPSRPQSLPAL